MWGAGSGFVRSVLPAPPVIVSSPSHRVSRGARPGLAEDLEVVGDGAQPDPALHAGRSTVPTPAQPVTPLEGTDASLASGAPAQGRAGGAGPRRAGVPRQHNVPHAPTPGPVVIRRRGQAAIGHSQPRRAGEQGDVPIGPR